MFSLPDRFKKNVCFYFLKLNPHTGSFPGLRETAAIGEDMLSVFGLVTLNSNGHDVITAIKKSWSVFTFRSFAVGLVYF